MSRTVRIALYHNAVYAYLEDPAVPRNLLGPKGNFVQGVYGPGGSRIRYEAAIRGYGDEGHEIRDRLLAIADRIAASRGVGDGHGPSREQVIGRVAFR